MRRNPKLRPDSSRHTGLRTVLRVVGPIVLIVGLVLVGSGAYEIVAGDPFENEGLMFVRMFGGMPMIFVGLVLSGMGYVGAVARYQANEMAPIARDATNYLVDGTKGSIRTAAAAFGGGLREGLTGEVTQIDAVVCAQCGHDNDADAKYCDDCGAALRVHATCAKCGVENDADARFCDSCGTAMASA